MCFSFKPDAVAQRLSTSVEIRNDGRPQLLKEARLPGISAWQQEDFIPTGWLNMASALLLEGRYARIIRHDDRHTRCCCRRQSVGADHRKSSRPVSGFAASRRLQRAASLTVTGAREPTSLPLTSENSSLRGMNQIRITISPACITKITGQKTPSS